MSLFARHLLGEPARQGRVVRIGFVAKSLNQEYWVNTEKPRRGAARDHVHVLTKAASNQVRDKLGHTGRGLGASR